MPPQVVLFDFDGVIADTENIHIAAWERTFAMMGCDVETEICSRAAEEDDRDFLRSVLKAREIIDADIEGWVARKQAMALTMLQDSPRIYDGVKALVRELRSRQIRLAIVTSTCRENVSVVLQSTGLAADFVTIVAKEDVTAPKPHPDPYLLALKRMEARASQAVAFEDSPTGLAAAKAAGLRAIAVGHRRPNGDWVGDSPFLENFEDLDRVLALPSL